MRYITLEDFRVTKIEQAAETSCPFQGFVKVAGDHARSRKTHRPSYWLFSSRQSATKPSNPTALRPPMCPKPSHLHFFPCSTEPSDPWSSDRPLPKNDRMAMSELSQFLEGAWDPFLRTGLGDYHAFNKVWDKPQGRMHSHLLAS